jgi:hypothetical protein
MEHFLETAARNPELIPYAIATGAVVGMAFAGLCAMAIGAWLESRNSPAARYARKSAARRKARGL